MLQNLRGLRKSSEIPRAKHVLSLIEGRAKGAKFGNLFFFFAAFAVFARDHPISSFAPLALFAVNYPNPKPNSGAMNRAPTL